MEGWIGNIFIIGGLWGIGNKVRNAFLLSIIGELCYIIRSYRAKDWPLFAVCWVFALMAARGWWKWR